MSKLSSLRGGPPALVDLVGKLGRLVRARLWLQIVAAMVIGVSTGLLLSPSGGALLPQRHAEVITGWLVLPGQLFLALIQMIVVPLVMSSVVLGITSSEDKAYLRRIGLRIGLYFIATTTLAVTIGIALATVIRPGGFLDPSLVEAALAATGTPSADPAAAAPVLGIPDRLIGLIPQNPLAAALDQSMLQIVIFAILIGVALMNIPPVRARPLLDLSASVQQLSMEIVSWAMVLAPLAVLGLLAQITMKIGFAVIVGMSVYVGTVLLGLALLLVVYGVIVRVAGGWRFSVFFRAIREVQLLAFSTSSSAAVMPLSLETAQKKLRVQPAIAQFVVPLGATVNMDGTALYQVIAAVFLTQVFGVELTAPALVLLIATTVGASIGSPSTPGVGIVILATILQSVGVPASGIALIIGVDRILDMSRTAINVTGDLTACVAMNRLLPPPEGDPVPAEGAEPLAI